MDVRFGLKADMCTGSHGGEYVVGRHGSMEALECKITNGFDGHGIFDRH
jgi:hypothetical protein